MMRGDLCGHIDSSGLRQRDDLDRAGGRDVADVQPGVDVRGQQHIPWQ